MHFLPADKERIEFLAVGRINGARARGRRGIGHLQLGHECIKHAGYDVKTIPTVREAIEWKQCSIARKYIPIVAATLDDYSARLDAAW